ncbi:hypothetical protein PICSAR30_03446 [Mycobacterium avium subsp. paratuberculosis]|nr:hypothetical protein PICSAR252_04291 [Mycobacterium avium subsp. paratuberculosis]CAG7267489.1 hypothetical protein PICSAR30_03446 [Mycobacterium avium subsp. paratuberculosis]
MLHQREHPVEQQGRVDGQVVLGEDRGLDRGVGEALRELLAAALGGQPAVGGPVAETVMALEPDHHAERARRDLRVQAGAGRVRIGGQVQHLAPQVRVGVHLDQRERHRPVDLAAEPAHPVQLLLGPDDVLARGPLRGQLEHRLTAGRHGAAQTEQLLLGGERAGHGLAVHRAVAHRARRGEAERAGLDRLADQPAHRLDVVGGGRLVAGAALAHRVGPDRAVRDLAADVDGELLLADRVEVFGVGLPPPGDALGQRGAGNVLDTLHQLDQPLLGARPHRGEADPAVAGDHGGDAVTAGRLEQTVPAHLAVVVGVDVDEAGSHDFPCGIDGFGGLGGRQAAGLGAVGADDVDDLAVPDADVGAIALRARPVDDGSAGDFQVEHETPLRRRGPSRRAERRTRHISLR